jgi:hypothetical protein
VDPGMGVGEPAGGLGCRSALVISVRSRPFQRLGPLRISPNGPA